MTANDWEYPEPSPEDKFILRGGQIILAIVLVVAIAVAAVIGAMAVMIKLLLF